jgi:hypothetical protein
MPDWAQSRGGVPEIEVIIPTQFELRSCQAKLYGQLYALSSKNPYKLSEARNTL